MDVLTKRDTDYFRECRGLTSPANVLDLCDTCEALRAEVERLAGERAAIVAIGNATLARAEKAERERDEVKYLFCSEIAKHGERIYGEGDRCAWNTPRKVCLMRWPDDADRLFPAAEVVTVAGEDGR